MNAPRDEELLAELSSVLNALAEPPVDVLDAAKGLFVWRTIDAELAELTHDSLLDAAAGGARRSRAAGQPRLLTFRADGCSIEAEIDSAPGARRLIGQIVPPGPADLELQSDAAQAQTRADERGRFVLPLPVEEVRLRLRCVTGEQTVETSWVLV